MLLTLGAICCLALAATAGAFAAKQKIRRAVAYGASALAVLAVITWLWPGALNNSGQTDVVSLGLSAGYVDFNDSVTGVEQIAAQSPRSALPSVPAMISQLENRLGKEPGDAKGWSLLAQSYAYIGNTDGTEHAVANAVRLGIPEDALRSQVAIVEQEMRRAP